ncbi:MAG: hypothetical protein ACRDFA_07060 [bacterium]
MRIRTIMVVLTLGSILMLPAAAHADTQLYIWPSTYSYATPSGTFAWNTTALGLKFDQGFGPLGFRTMLFYGPVSNFSFAGSGLSGYGGQVVGGEGGLRFGLGLGPVGVGAFAGYGGFVMNARGPSAPDAVLLSSLGLRLGVDARAALAPGVTLRGNWTRLSGLNSRADISLSSPLVGAQHTGVGNGSEYTIGVTISPLPLVSVFADYRSASLQTNWSGGGSTTTSYSGYFLGVGLRF